MINPDKQVSDMDTVANVAPSTGRRRLVKGAMLATPAVMTLMSGRLASAVSQVHCNIDVNGDPIPDEQLSNGCWSSVYPSQTRPPV